MKAEETEQWVKVQVSFQDLNLVTWNVNFLLNLVMFGTQVWAIG